MTRSADPDLAADLAALEAAARAAVAYRAAMPGAERWPVKAYDALLADFRAPTPETGADPAALIEELAAKSEPGLRGATGSRFFGWVIGASHPAGVAADWLASAWGQNSANVTAAPAACAVEQVACEWLLDLLDLPRQSSIGLVTGATVANFVCLAAARSAVLAKAGWDVERDGLFGAPEVHVVLGEDAHSTLYSALKYLGLGAGRVKKVATDDQGRMLPAAFAETLRTLKGPIIAIAQAGQINTGAFDPMDEIAPLAKAAGAWLHVDGAFGLWARACPSRAHLGKGFELADSWGTDGHKWLQTPYDCGFAIVRDAEAHRRAMAISASYLPPAEGEARDPSQYVMELSRRGRGFATWAVIKALGRAGIAEMVERHCRFAADLAQRLAREPGVRIVNDVVLNQIIIRFGEGEGSDAETLAVIDRVQEDARCFMGGGMWRGEWVMRVSVCGGPTGPADLEPVAEAVIDAWRAVRA